MGGLDEARRQIEDYICTLFPGQALVERASEYSSAGGGHLWRPLLLLHAAGGYGVPNAQALPYAAAVELVHASSLVLDDMPAMDNSALRRGMESCHSRFGEATAMLCNNYLIAKAISLVALGPAGERRNNTILREVASLASDLIMGQERDLARDSPSLEEMLDLYSKKSGSLFAASLVAGGILGDAPAREIEILRALGHELGIAYQLKDDLEDMDSDESSIARRYGAVAAKNILHGHAIRVQDGLKAVAAGRMLEPVIAEMLGKAIGQA